jgi:hypothetical protein
MLVALCGRGFTRDGRRSRRDDDSGLGMAFCHRIVNSLAVIGAVAGHRGDRALNLVEQIRNHRNIADIVRGQFHGGDLMGVGVDREMKFPPAAA